MFSAFYISFSHLILTNILRGRYYYYFLFIVRNQTSEKLCKGPQLGLGIKLQTKFLKALGVHCRIFMKLHILSKNDYI